MTPHHGLLTIDAASLPTDELVAQFAEQHPNVFDAIVSAGRKPVVAGRRPASGGDKLADRAAASTTQADRVRELTARIGAEQQRTKATTGRDISPVAALAALKSRGAIPPT